MHEPPANDHQRLWTPWRMRYISGDSREDGCIFCNRYAGENDVESLILYRGNHSYLIMNLFPYNTGHVMLVPNQHAAELEELDRDTLHEMSELLPVVTAALRRVLNCDGFNIGLNLGSVAGAGVAAHLHQHIVPRWEGDANFMPIIASTMAIPEVIPSTYAKIRAEIARQLVPQDETALVVLTDNDQSLLLKNGRLPRIVPSPGLAITQQAMYALRAQVSEIEVAGWAGEPMAHDASRPIALTLRGERSSTRGDFVPVSIALADSSGLTQSERATVGRALDQLAPSVAPPTDITQPEG